MFINEPQTIKTMIKLLLNILLLANLTTQTGKSDAEFSIVFEKVDNQVEIYAGKELLYTSGLIGNNPELNLSYTFKLSDIKGSEITIKLKNGVTEDGNESDRHWEIMYELFKNNEPVDYQWESADDYKTGIVFEKTYDLSTL